MADLPGHVLGIVPADWKCTAVRPGHHHTDICGTPATWHIIWDSAGENGRACDACLSYARSFPHELVHPHTVECAMPGSLLLWDQNRCVMPDDGNTLALATAEGTESRG